MLNSFYAKLSALLLLLLVTLGIVLSVLGVRSAQRYADEVEQKLNRTLAEEMVPRFEPLIRDSIDTRAIEATIQDMTGINRRIEIYLLEGDGRLKKSFARTEAEIEQRAVPLQPIQRFLNGGELPILGLDPRDPAHPKPFSAASIEIMGQKGCYLYVVLGSEQYASLARMLEDSYILQTTLQGFAIVLLAAAGIGLLLFRRLTKRLRGMQDVVTEFESGNYDARMAVTTRDEIGTLAACFNRMADTLVSTLEELRRADRMRRELIANVSHDLRSPLASIQGYLETLRMKAGSLDAADRRRYVRTALQNTQRLSALVEELFQLSKLESEQIDPTLEPFSPAELAQDVVVQYRPQAEDRGVHLEARLPDRHVRVEGDIGLVERVLSNLIDNAIHYTPEGGRVCVDVRSQDDGVRIWVRDNGPGIPEDDLPHIFERFYRVDKSRDKTSGGAGLGLAIAHKILDLHGQELHVRSTVGEGTAFHFHLPAPPASGS